MTAFIWLPIAPERYWVHVDRMVTSAAADPAAQPVPGDQLLAGPAVYDIMRNGNLPSRGVGWPHLLALLSGLPGAVYAWSRRRRNLAILLAVSTLAGLALLWMLSSASDFLWQALRPILTLLQYRVRLMGLLALATAVSAGLLVALLPPRWQTRAAAVVVAILISLAWPSLYVNLQHKYGDFDDRLNWEIVRQAEIKSGGSAFTSWGEFLPRWRTDPFDRALLDQIGPNFDPQRTPVLDPPAGLSVVAERIDSVRWDLAIEAAHPATLTLPLLYYPRWRATLDGEPATLRPQEGSGYVQLDAPQGNYRLALRYHRTLAETLGLIISLVALAALVGWAVRGKEGQVTSAGQRAPRHEDGRKDQAVPPGWLLIGLAAILAVKWLIIDPSTTWLRCVSTPERVCGAAATVDVPFAGGHRLRGYTVPSYRVKAGDMLRVDLFWQAEPGLDRPLHSFVHIRNSQPEQAMEPITSSEIWAQEDHINPAGLFTSEFMPGKLYYDEMRVVIPKTMPAGEYFLEIGWFDPATGEQLEPAAETVEPPLGILWRSILLPSVTIIE